MRYPLKPTGPVEESLRVEMKKMQIMFEVENLDFHVPRLCIKTSLLADVRDWSKQVRDGIFPYFSIILGCYVGCRASQIRPRLNLNFVPISKERLLT